jgi:hypothetical protein
MSLEHLKDGKLLVFRGMNWRLAGDSKWVEHCVQYVVNGHERYVGDRMINGTLHSVFMLCDDDFGAQPKSDE